MKHPMKIDHPETPYTKAHIDGTTPGVKLEKMKEPNPSWEVLNPGMKGYLRAKVMDPEAAFPVRPPTMVPGDTYEAK